MLHGKDAGAVRAVLCISRVRKDVGEPECLSFVRDKMGEGWVRRRLNLNPEISAVTEQTTVLVQLSANTKAVEVCVHLESWGN